jgi:hypothetical protein
MRNIAEEKKERPPIRPTARPETSEGTDVASESPRERAARRAAELRGHNNANLDEGVDKFATPTPPDGWSYEWKMKSVMGWEDPSHYNRITIGGWEPVESFRHPEMMPKGYVGSIEREGMVLCERPLEITEERKHRDYLNARQQVKIKQGQLDPKGKGGLISREDAQIAPKIKSSYEPMPIPD